MGVAIFASGNGSNFEALVHHSRKHAWADEIRLLFCDRRGAGVIGRAQRLKIPRFNGAPRNLPIKRLMKDGCSGC